jgi:hypothetical protein
MAAKVSVETACDVMELCEARYKELLDGGCVEDVAADRVWDALNCALEKEDTHCFDPRDRVFESRLRAVAQEGK